MKTLAFLCLLSILFISPVQVFAHPGRTDRYGCHTCRTNCPSWGLSYGEYHCHRSKGVPQPLEPIKSTHGDNGTGHTSPAPEYKQPVKISEPNTESKQVEQKNQDGWFKRFLKIFSN